MNDQLVERIRNDFTFHPATDKTGPKHDYIRNICMDMALHLLDTCPSGRELSLALTSLEETMHWANAAIAKNL